MTARLLNPSRARKHFDVTAEAVLDALRVANMPVTAAHLAQGICDRSRRACREADRRAVCKVVRTLADAGEIHAVGIAPATGHSGRPARLWALATANELPTGEAAA